MGEPGGERVQVLEVRDQIVVDGFEQPLLRERLRVLARYERHVDAAVGGGGQFGDDLLVGAVLGDGHGRADGRLEPGGKVLRHIAVPGRDGEPLFAEIRLGVERRGGGGAVSARSAVAAAGGEKEHEDGRRRRHGHMPEPQCA
ncbi:hypothetical protein SANT12839_001990 [Streptomyces antimycoticus]|uniref:Uncharacterized protein n=1 Tax=Streptomyces antimycoticus TaxID=68175 RepID=A0A4D4JZ93_9ACTN|nr:hypothetical protein SANT12839_001990 [Streptomyces antimycoticus]